MEGFTPAYRIADSTNPDDWGTVTSTWDAVTIVSGSTGYRLPTEAQWEYAAKGGNPLAPGWVLYIYAGSDDPDEVAWYGDIRDPVHLVWSKGGTCHAVGTKAPNGLGLYDMSGNVWEWCWDWGGANYTAEDKTDPQGPPSSPSLEPWRVARGGNWKYPADGSARFIRSAFRYGGENPGSRNGFGDGFGFRVVRPAP
jgi:formylglycine-generating enzyme required for sulfatase activity